ncbi:MAG TPA: Ldh family oxidoreductase [bacterium]|nr:Ldh family oxidoreductase [bacterium]
MPGLRFRADALRTVAARIFIAIRTPDDVAAVVADTLVEANLMGHDSHGVLRVPQYVGAAREGRLKVAARPRRVTARGATAFVSGEWGFGQLTGRLAMDEAVRLAHEYGIGAAAAIRCTHLGRVGDYVERAAAHGCVGMAWVGGLHPAAVPYGGRRRTLGTNPMAVGFPVAGDHPVVLDFATTMIAAGKIAAARAAKKPLPPGRIVDRDGTSATDPQAFYDGGALLPFGEHKGYALSTVVDLLGQALTGAERPDEHGDVQPGERRSGALFIAVSTGAFRPAEDAAAAARSIVDRLRDVPTAPGFDRVLTPGQPEALMRARWLRDGIEVAEATWQAIRDTAAAAGLAAAALPEPMG